MTENSTLQEQFGEGGLIKTSSMIEPSASNELRGKD
jgi:hypothetical protein